jgi:hypothetical protein
MVESVPKTMMRVLSGRLNSLRRSPFRAKFTDTLLPYSSA